MNDQNAKSTHLIDQFIASFNPIAKLITAIYNEFIAVGMPEELAIALTRDYFRMVIEKTSGDIP